MSHTSGESQFGGRFQIAGNIEIGRALQAIDDRMNALDTDIQAQIDSVLRQLLPDNVLSVVGLPRGALISRDIGNGDISYLQKVLLVRTVPGAFPSSVTVKHQDIPGVFVLDANTPSLDIGIQQYGERHIEVTNNDAGIDCAVWFVHRRVS